MFFEHQYQLAYLTSDLDKAVKILGEEFGAPAFQWFNNGEVVTNRLWTPEGEQDAVARGGVCQIGHLNVELIQPLNEDLQIFRNWLAPGVLMRVHHLAMRVLDLDAVREESAKLGRPTVAAGKFGPAQFIYVDATATLGHYIEYVQAPSEHWKQRGAHVQF